VSERYPEFWVLAASAAAWVVLAARAGVQHTWVHSGPGANWRHWMLMVTAMMLPLQIQGVRLTAERSLWVRRHRAILGYLLGYLSVWALAGVPLALAFTRLGISHRIGWMQGTAMGFVLAAAWLVSPWKETVARMCHRTVPLSPAGWRADRDCLGYGWAAGSACALNCWPLMLVCWLSGHSFIAMVLGFGLACVDRHGAPNYRLHATAAAMLGLAFAVLSQLRS
jgi:hypothetical protein